MDTVIHREKSFLQKVSKISGTISFIFAFIGMVILLMYGDVLGDVYKASTGALSFFFFSAGIVLSTIGNTNLPILKISTTDKQE